MGDHEMMILSGTAYYAKIKNPDKESEKYSMELVPDDKSKKMIESIGVTLKNKRKGVGVQKADPESPIDGDFVTLKSAYPPKVRDSQNNLVDPVPLMGNGSKVRVASKPYDVTKGPAKGKTMLGLSGVQIIELVEYKEQPMFDAVDGYVASETETKVDEDDPFA